MVTFVQGLGADAAIGDLVENAGYVLEPAVAAGLEIGYLVYFPTTGVLSVELKITPPLPKHTLVRSFDVRVGAARASQVAAKTVGQVRTQSQGGSHSVVIDFGAPRTIVSVSPPGDAKVTGVRAWTGAQFGEPFFIGHPGAAVAVFSSEVRTDRLMIDLSKSVDAGEIVLELPDPPADLSISINGGAPVWNSPGPVLPAASSTPKVPPTDAAFNEDAERIVHLANALNALLADKHSTTAVDLTVCLTSKVPGVLQLVAEGTPVYDYIQRVSFAGDSSHDFVFPEEGLQTLPLDLPAVAAGRRRQVKEVRVTVAGNLPPERVLPPIGPEPVLLGDGTPLAELVIDPDRAVCLKLAHDNGLAELTALRLPLAAGGDGAELRAALWTDGDGLPDMPLDNGSSEPVTLGGGSPAVWSTFTFSKPVKLDSPSGYWAALLVSRGAVTSALTEAGGSAIRHGAPNGPWRELPLPLRGSGGLLDAHACLRLAGLASKAAPIAPLDVALTGASDAVTKVTPTAKGVAVTMSFATPVDIGTAMPSLTVISRVAGSVTIRDIDVIWHEA